MRRRPPWNATGRPPWRTRAPPRHGPEARVSLASRLPWRGSYGAPPTRPPPQIGGGLPTLRSTNDPLEGKPPSPPFGPPEGAEGKATAQDVWGIQPIPKYHRLGFRELVKIHNDRLARQAAQQHSAP